MQVGDKVVCVDNKDYRNIYKNKIYEITKFGYKSLCVRLLVVDVISISYTLIQVVDIITIDRGRAVIPYKKRYHPLHYFKKLTLSQYRNRLIDEICK